jgi:hypothetical protein
MPRGLVILLLALASWVPVATVIWAAFIVSGQL